MPLDKRLQINHDIEVGYKYISGVGYLGVFLNKKTFIPEQSVFLMASSHYFDKGGYLTTAPNDPFYRSMWDVLLDYKRKYGLLSGTSYPKTSEWWQEPN